MSYSQNTTILLVLLLAFSCSSKDQSIDENTKQDRKILLRDKIQPSIDFSSKDIEIGTDLFSVGNISEHLFGDFFEESVSFYVIEDVKFEMGSSEYDAKLVLCFINEILFQKKYHLDTFDLRVFSIKYNCESKIGQEQIQDFKSSRFYTLKVNSNGKRVLLKKHDFDLYSIEEYHEFFPQAWRLATI